ncbi:hypothetical protein AB4Z10_26085 [Bosea sp. RAF48]|uniref:hypothetical protein n=1 Tax=Bosea sp. RAF48 TaxID=3237480 RepID=UPI003F93BBC0
MEASGPSNCDEVLAALPGTDSVRSQLTRIIGSADFDAPGRVKAFFQFIVDETLAGRGSRLKAFTIAVAVFGRSQSFDAMNDPVVRIEAARLRRALERYYLLNGRHDRVIIEVAKGSYVPNFRWRDGATPSPPLTEPPDVEARSGTVSLVGVAERCGILLGGIFFAVALSLIAVMLLTGREQWAPSASLEAVAPQMIVKPFVSLSPSSESAAFAAGLSEEVLNRLAQQKRLRVFGKDGPAGETSVDPGYRIARQYIVEGSVRQSGNTLRVVTRLIDARTAAVKWADSVDADPRAGSDMEATLATKLADLVVLQTEVPSSSAEALARTARDRRSSESPPDSPAWPPGDTEPRNPREFRVSVRAAPGGHPFPQDSDSTQQTR